MLPLSSGLDLISVKKDLVLLPITIVTLMFLLRVILAVIIFGLRLGRLNVLLSPGILHEESLIVVHLPDDIEDVILLYALVQVVLGEPCIEALPELAAHARHVCIARVLHLVPHLLVEEDELVVEVVVVVLETHHTAHERRVLHDRLLDLRRQLVLRD